MKAQSTKLHLWLCKINIKLYQKIVKLPNSTYTGKKQEYWLQQRRNWMETHMVKRIYTYNCHNNLEILHHFQKQANCRLIHKQNIKQDESGCGCPIKTFVARLMHNMQLESELNVLWEQQPKIDIFLYFSILETMHSLHVFFTTPKWNKMIAWSLRKITGPGIIANTAHKSMEKIIFPSLLSPLHPEQ